LQDKWGHLLYNYFNWRQDNTSKVLLLIFTLFFSFVMLGSATHRWVSDDAAERGAGGLWNDVYQASAAGQGHRGSRGTASSSEGTLQRCIAEAAMVTLAARCLQADT
jgi:hypothetical protein